MDKIYRCFLIITYFDNTPKNEIELGYYKSEDKLCLEKKLMWKGLTVLKELDLEIEGMKYIEVWPWEFPSEYITDKILKQIQIL